MRRQTAGAACRNYRPVQTRRASSDARFATASLPGHRAGPRLRKVDRCLRVFVVRIVNLSEKPPRENKIPHEVRLLGCDLMWRKLVLPDYPVNSTRWVGKAASSRAPDDGPRAPTIFIPIHGWIGGYGARSPLPTIRAASTPPAPYPKTRPPRCAACRTGCRVRGRSPAPRTQPCRSRPPLW